MDSIEPLLLRLRKLARHLVEPIALALSACSQSGGIRSGGIRSGGIGSGGGRSGGGLRSRLHNLLKPHVVT